MGSVEEVDKACWSIIEPLLHVADVPVLKTLKLSISSGGHEKYLPDVFCAQTATSTMTRLSLKNCLVRAHSPLLTRGITSLSLHIDNWPLDPAYTTDIRSLLVKMDQLQELRLVNVAPCHEQAGPSTVILPTCFRKLDETLDERRSTTTAAMINFLSGVILPLAARASYRLIDVHPNQEDVSRVLPGLLSALFHIDQQVEIRMTTTSTALRPSIPLHSEDEYAEFSSIQQFADEASLTTACQVRTIETENFEDYFSAPLQCIGGILPLDKVDAFHLAASVLPYILQEIAVASDEDIWEPCSSLSDVETITVELLLDDHELFFSVLSRRDPRTLLSSAPLFPTLRTLVILHTPAPASVWMRTQSEIRRETALAQAGLISFLEFRSAIGSSLEVDHTYSSWTVWSSIPKQRYASSIHITPYEQSSRTQLLRFTGATNGSTASSIIHSIIKLRWA